MAALLVVDDQRGQCPRRGLVPGREAETGANLDVDSLTPLVRPAAKVRVVDESPPERLFLVNGAEDVLGRAGLEQLPEMKRRGASCVERTGC